MCTIKICVKIDMEESSLVSLVKNVGKVVYLTRKL